MKDLPSNLQKLCDGVEAALSLKQSDFGLFSTHYFELLEEGMIDEHDLYISFKKLEKVCEAILPLLKDKIDETKLFGDGYNKHGVKLSSQNGRSFYDYSTCNDPIRSELLVYAEQLKSREKFLQSIKTPNTEIIDKETGEVIVLNPPIRKQGVSVVLRYLKDDE